MRRRRILSGRKTLTRPPACRRDRSTPRCRRCVPIVQQPHFHSLAGPSSQCFQEPEAGRVRPKDECFQVDVMLGGANRVQHGGERGMALVIEDEVVSGADGRRAKAAGQSANLFPTGGLHTRGRRPVLHLLRLTRDRLLRCRYPLLHESLSMPPLARQRPANVLIAEEQEEEGTDQWQHEYQQAPGDCGGRILFSHQNPADHGQTQDRAEDGDAGGDEFPVRLNLIPEGHRRRTIK